MKTIKSQKEFLALAKKTLESRAGKMTWDELSVMAGVEPRALKTYRMPESSADYRPMPGVVRQAIESLLARPVNTLRHSSSLIPALAALVLSQARISLIDKQMITGTDRRRGSRNGLSEDERKIMAMVSRACLVNGLKDHGGEIHELLHLCSKPFCEWLPIAEVMEAGYGTTSLINAQYGIPTPEAEELASEFTTVTAHIEEALFSKLMEALSKVPTVSGDDYYTAIREFVVRNPVTTEKQLFEAGRMIPSAIWMAIQYEYYEPVPRAQACGDAVTLCAHCNSLMKRVGGGGMTCPSVACSSSRPAEAGAVIPVAEARRVTRGIRQYWVEPGIDEILLFDCLKKKGAAPLLYPHRDRVDIAMGRIGMDMKTYVSPEILGAKFRRGLGGLAFYEKKWLVIPDWLIASTPLYMNRLVGAMAEGASRIRCLSLSDASKFAPKEA
ncbi:hypothetical protein [Propionivibrio sp.]|uniref:restriction endonuclease-related protein n=1 Tax=Propionivibrio sp. TaxID=2212460 RepID=UPI003BF2F70B